MIWRRARSRVGRWTRSLTGASETVAARAELAAARAELAALRADVAQVAGAVSRLEEHAVIDVERRRIELDDASSLRALLDAVRSEPDYGRPFVDEDPLVTVRIATYQRSDQLLEVALRSVFEQTHSNLEVVIVHDGPDAATRRAVDALGDPRVRYHELPYRGVYPEHALSRWRVAGTPAGNLGLELARGAWIAPLDDDDEFTPDHIERLLDVARSTRAEVAYGAVIQRNLVTGDRVRIWSDPPAWGAFAPQGALFHRGLARFTYEPTAWTVHEPGDWNLMRRLLLAGVRTAATDDVVATLNWVPVEHKRS